MIFVDTHTHLHFPDFSLDVEAVIERARKAGVRYLINVGTNLESTRQAIRLSERYEFIHATVGLHPHDAKDATPETLAELEKLAEHPKVVAIGEVGLDFYRNLSPEAIQRRIFSYFLELASRSSLPLVLHIRDAYDAMIDLLEAHAKRPVRGVSHCFSGSEDVMERLLRLGLYISFAGPVSYKKNDSLRRAAARCPEDRILIETDAPYLAPQAFRGKRNEPAHLIETAKLVAELRGIDAEALSRITSRNAERLFQRTFRNDLG